MESGSIYQENPEALQAVAGCSRTERRAGEEYWHRQEDREREAPPRRKALETIAIKISGGLRVVLNAYINRAKRADYNIVLCSVTATQKRNMFCGLGEKLKFQPRLNVQNLWKEAGCRGYGTIDVVMAWPGGRGCTVGARLWPCEFLTDDQQDRVFLS